MKQLLGHRIIPKIAVSIFFLSWIIAIVMRFIGEMAGINILRDTVPIKGAIAASGFLTLSVLIVSGIRKSRFLSVYLLSFFMLTGFLTAHLVASTPAEANSWNTTPFEFLRSFSLGMLFLAIFYVRKETNIDLNFTYRSVIPLYFLTIAFAYLQSLNILPNFYFQWYAGNHLPRPTGGMDHPHFFSLMLLQGMCLAALLRSRSRISKRAESYIIIAFFIGIMLSTSRVGLVSAIFFITALAILRALQKNPSQVIVLSGAAAYLLLVLGIFVALNWSLLSETPEGLAAEVFFSAFYDSFFAVDDERVFLRGRSEHWATEISFISRDSFTLLFGYGHQPYVSHNLLLRQLQVSGVLGTLAYVTMLVTTIAYWLKLSQSVTRPVVLAFILATLLASLTFPILVSIPFVSGLVLLGLVSIGSATRNSSGGPSHLKAQSL